MILDVKSIKSHYEFKFEFVINLIFFGAQVIIDSFSPKSSTFISSYNQSYSYRKVGGNVIEKLKK